MHAKLGRELEDGGSDGVDLVLDEVLRVETREISQSTERVSSEAGLHGMSDDIGNGGTFSSGTSVRCVSLSSMPVILGLAHVSGNGYDVGGAG